MRRLNADRAVRPLWAMHLRHMLVQPWPGHPDAALTDRADIRSACDARGVVDAVFRREPDQDPDRALDVLRHEARVVR